MTPERIAHFRSLLLAQHGALHTVAIDPLRDDDTGKPDEDLQPLAEMSQVIASKRNLSRIGSRKQIAEALERLEKEPDSFGRCDECDEAIPPGRLEVMPWATKCVACQGATEGPKGGARKHLTDYK